MKRANARDTLIVGAHMTPVVSFIAELT